MGPPHDTPLLSPPSLPVRQNIRAMERDGDAEGEGHPLLEAVQSCIAAAAGEFDVGRQQVHLTVTMGHSCMGDSNLSIIFDDSDWQMFVVLGQSVLTILIGQSPGALEAYKQQHHVVRGRSHLPVPLFAWFLFTWQAFFAVGLFVLFFCLSPCLLVYCLLARVIQVQETSLNTRLTASTINTAVRVAFSPMLVMFNTLCTKQNNGTNDILEYLIEEVIIEVNSWNADLLLYS